MRRILSLALLLALATPAAAQIGVPPPGTGVPTPAPGAAPCTAFSTFPLTLNLGTDALSGRDGITSRCGFTTMQTALNALAGSVSTNTTAIGTLAPLASPIFTGTASIPTLALTGSGSTGDVSSMSNLGRTLATRAQDVLNVRDAPYNAKCDGSTNDTAAFTSVFADAASKVKSVYVPAGTCMVSGLTYPSLPYAQQFSIYGDGQNVTRIKLIAGSTKPTLTIGASNATNFTANIVFRGITFDGNGQGQPAVVSYDLVRSRFQDVLFTGGLYGYQSFGGIGNVIDADARGNITGAQFTKFTSAAGGGWPNLIRWQGAIAGNSTVGLNIDYARGFTCLNCDIEGNGTTYNTVGQGGVLIGSNMGTELSSVGMTLGFECRGCWFEANLGHADILSSSGMTVVDASNFASAANQTLYDMHFNGGGYVVTGTTGAFSKTTVKDETTVTSGIILGGFLPGLSTVKAAQVQTASATNLSSLLTAGGGAQVTGGTFTLATHSLASGTAPTINFCGTSPVMLGTDSAGTVTAGTGGPSGCTILFAAAYTNPPICTVSSRGGVAITYTTAVDRLTISTTNSAAFSGSVLDYTCTGR